MKVKALIERLQKLDPGLDVICYTEDPALLLPGHGTRPLEIEDVIEDEAQTGKDRDEVPFLKFGRGFPKHAFINVTSDF